MDFTGGYAEKSLLPHPQMQDEFVFRVESTGVLKAEAIVRSAMAIIVEKINTMSVAVREVQSNDS